MDEKLSIYRQKRDFNHTSEPEGNNKKEGESLRYVIQHHIASRDHYDFRLEWNGVLLSWAVPKGPSYLTQDKRLAIHVEDHPMEYRNFEGTIPKGEYGGGVVMLWDEGFWEPEVDVDEGLNKGMLKFTLRGTKLRGRWALVRLRGSENQKNWLLIKEKDSYANAIDKIVEYDTSIRTGRTMMEIEEGKEL